MKQTFLILLACLLAPLSQAAISVGPNGVGPLAFPTNPIVTEFGTTVLIGTGPTFADVASVDTAVAAFDANTYTPAFKQLPTSTTVPPSASSVGFRYNPAAFYIQSRPTTDGTNGASVLLATLQNDSGAARSSIIVSYDFALATASLGAADQLPGFHVYYSFSGTAGSWTKIGGLSATEFVGNQSATVNVGSWPVGGLLYLLWIDDNDDGDTDPAYAIDNFRINFTIPPPTIITHPGYSSNLVTRTVGLSVVADGIGLQYQWQKVGVGPIDPVANPSAATANLVITNAQLSDTGDYFVIVSNGSGGVPSNNGHIDVMPDIYAPRLLRAQPGANPNLFELVVDELLCTDTLTCGANVTCTFNWGIFPLDNFGVEGADLVVEEVIPTGTNITFRTSSPHTAGAKYRIKVIGDCDGGINDVFGNQLAAGAPGSTIDTLPAATFTATQDAEIHSNAGADTTFGQATTVGVDNDDAGIARGLLRFEGLIGGGPGQIPAGSTIISATLRLNQVDAGASANLHRMLIPWDEATVTWNSLVEGPTNDGVEAVIASDALSPNAAANGAVNINVTTSVQAWANGAVNYGWAFLSTGTDGWDWESSESANAPTLTVVYQAVPCVPGGAGISIQPPSTLSVAEGNPFTLAPTFTNNCNNPTYQWTKNGNIIPGATSDSYSVASAVAGPTGDSGTYRVSVTQDGVTVTSSPSTVTVVAETNRPFVTSVESVSPTSIVVTYSEAVKDGVGTYTVTGTPAVTVSSVVLSTDRRTATITTTARTIGGSYSLRIQNVTDSAGTPNLINPNPTVVPLTTVLVIDGWNSTWSYETNNQDATLSGTPWYAPAFSVAAWPTGNALFGIETSAGVVALFPTPIATPMLPNTNTPPDMITYYFRKQITLPAIPAGTSYAINHFIDDGAVFYLDGVEIGRVNMVTPAVDPQITYTNRATTAGEATAMSLPFSAAAGTHTLAVEVHQGGATTSSDMLFGAEIIAISTASPRLNIAKSGNNAVLTWSADSSWALERANVVSGPYAVVAPTSGFGVHTNVTQGNATNLFFRLSYQP